MIARFSIAAAVVLAAIAFGDRPALAQHGAGGGTDDARLSKVGRAIESLEFENLAWKVPAIGREVERLELPNGLTFFLYPETSVPRVGIVVRLVDGKLYEAEGEAQEASFVTQLIQLGGSTSKSGEEVDALIDRIAARFALWSGDDRLGGTMRCLRRDETTAIDLLADLLLHPAFPEDRLALVKKAERESLLRQKDQPGWVSTTILLNQLFGDHPFGHIVGLADLEAVTREDLKRRHAHSFDPRRTAIGVAGDFDRDAMVELLTRTFGDWQRGSWDPPPAPALAAAPSPGVYHFPKVIPQSTIRIGHLSVGRGHPDEFALRIMNFVLGGQGISSRLAARVRSDEGLAYSVGSRYDLDTPIAGTFEARCETKAASTFRAIEIMRDEIARMQTAPPSERELERAQEALANSFIHRWANPVSALEQLMDLEVSGRPADYYATYLDRLRAVTVADVQRVAREHLHPDRLTIVIVGDAAAMGAPPAGMTLLPVKLPPEYMGDTAEALTPKTQ